jgi:hypothetical protein
MLPPDKESKGIFDPNTWKKLIKNYVFNFYDDSMPEKYMNDVIEAMTHELLELQSHDTRLASFEEFLTYMNRVSGNILNFYNKVEVYCENRLRAVIIFALKLNKIIILIQYLFSIRNCTITLLNVYIETTSSIWSTCVHFCLQAHTWTHIATIY